MGRVSLKRCSPSMLLSAGLDCHYDKELRRSESIEHANKDIDRTKTKLNYDVSPGFPTGIERDQMSWSQAKRKIQKKVDEIDEKIPPKRVREDRKTWFMLEIHCPKEIEKKGLEDEFFAKAFEALNASMDGNLIWGQIHKDEVHEYQKYTGKGNVESKESMMHMDVIGIPNDPEKGINMKSFMNQQRIKQMQVSVHAMVLKEFGVDMWTYEGHSDITVDQLKEQSATLVRTAEMTREAELKQGELERLKVQTDVERESLAEITESKAKLEGIEVPETWSPYHKGFGKDKHIESYEVPYAEAMNVLRRAELNSNLIEKEKELAVREAELRSKEVQVERDQTYARQKRSEALELKQDIQRERNTLSEQVAKEADEKIRDFTKELGIEKVWEEYNRSFDMERTHSMGISR